MGSFESEIALGDQIGALPGWAGQIVLHNYVAQCEPRCRFSWDTSIVDFGCFEY
jgi:hypothetical protein